MAPYSLVASSNWVGKELHLIYDEGYQEYPSVHLWSKTWIQTCWVCSLNVLSTLPRHFPAVLVSHQTWSYICNCEDSFGYLLPCLAVSLLCWSFTLTECLILCLSLPEGGSSSGLKTSSHTGGSGVEKRSYTHSSSYVTSSKELRHWAVSKKRARAAEMVWREIQARGAGWARGLWK